MTKQNVFGAMLVVLVAALLTIGVFLHFDVRKAEAQFQEEGGYPSDNWKYSLVSMQCDDKDITGYCRTKTAIIMTKDGTTIEYERSRELGGTRLIVKTSKGSANFSSHARGFFKNPIRKWNYSNGKGGEYVNGFFETYQEPEDVLRTAMDDLAYFSSQGKTLPSSKQDRLFAAIQLVQKESGI